MLIAIAQEPYKIFIAGLFGVFLLFWFLIAAVSNSDRWSKYAFVLCWVTYSCLLANWIQYFGIIALIAFAAAQALYALLVFHIFKLTSNSGIKPFMSLPFIWVSFELIQANIPFLGFSWLSFSTFALDTPYLRLSRVGGGALLTFVFVFVASFLSHLFTRYLAGTLDVNFLTKKSTSIYSVILLTVLAVLFSLSFVNLETSSEKVSVASIQGNDKNRILNAQERKRDYLQKSHIALATQLEQNYDYLVFPESAFRTDPNKDSDLMNNLRSVSDKANKLVILNTIATQEGNDFNRNYFYTPKMELIDYYDKKRLVPFGEYVPFKSLLGDLSVFDPIGTGFTPGSKTTTVDGVATLICYESTFSFDVARALSQNAELLVITTNNRSYKRSGNSAQHLAQTRIRAAEFGISIVHSSISGQSALIERDGSITASSELFTRAIIAGELTYGKADSIYAKTFDWLSLLAILVVGYLCIKNRKIYLWKNQISIK